MNQQEKLQENTTLLLNSFNTLNQATIEFKPSENMWSVMECVEHIFLINRAVAKIITEPTTDETIENTKIELFSEGKLNHLLVTKRLDFKVIAPDFSIPKGRFKTIAEATQSINSVMDTIITYLDTNDISKETQTIKHMRLGDMTKTDWIHFLIAHTTRHIVQIEEVKKLTP